MAIAFVRTRIVGRSSNQSAVACAAYRSGERLRDERYRRTQDYTRKEGVLATGIEAPEGAPAWARDRGKLWNAVERVERRRDARLAREFVVALPHELSQEENTEIIRGVAVDLAREGMVVDWAFHAPSRLGDDRNFHAHILMTTREITPQGFGDKSKNSRARTWNSEEWLTRQKEQIEARLNARLREKQAGQISFAAQRGRGGEHDGPFITDIKRRLRAMMREDLKDIIAAGEKYIAELDRAIRQAIEEAKQAARERERTRRSRDNDMGY